MDLLTEREIDQKIISLVDATRRRFTLTERCSGEDVCTALGLQLRYTALPPRTDGMLVDDSIVVINSSISWSSRVEFTIFHEVLHYLLNEDGELIDYFTETLGTDPVAYGLAIERCCHAGAAEFILPRRRVYERINMDGFSVNLIERLAEDYGASIVATAVQLAICAPVDCYVAVCSYGVSPRYWPPVQTLYVDQAAIRVGMRYPWARYAPVPREHLFHQAWESKRPLEGPSFVPFPRSGKRMPCQHGEAKPLGDRVLGILYLGHPPRAGQLGLNLE